MRIYFALPELLDHLGWTQKRLSQETGISENAISNLCNDPSGIKFDTLLKICKATEYQPASLFKLDPPYQDEIEFSYKTNS
jgi:DNA-binding Xre family transcriptional regulator